MMTTETNDLINTEEEYRFELESSYDAAYNEYKKLFENTTLRISEIYKKLNIPQFNNNPYYQYIRNRAKKEGLDSFKRNAYLRRTQYNESGSVEDINNEYENKYQQFLHYFKNTDLTIADILEKFNTTHKSLLYDYFKKRLNEDGLSVKERFKHNASIRMNGHKWIDPEERLHNFEKDYLKFKEYWINTDKSKKEIGKLIGKSINRDFGEYVNKRLKEDGLNIHRKTRRMDTEKYEELYLTIKDDWCKSPYDLSEYFKINYPEYYNRKAYRYCRQRCVEDDLLINNRKYSLSEKRMEYFYQNIKDDFYNSDLNYKEYMNQFNLSQAHSLFQYCIKRLREDKLLVHNKKLRQTGIITKLKDTWKVNFGDYYLGSYESKLEALEILQTARQYYQENKNLNLIRENYFKTKAMDSVRENYFNTKSIDSKYTIPGVNKKKYSYEVIRAYEDSETKLLSFFNERNIKKSTRKGYVTTFLKYLEYVGPLSLDEYLNKYFEEDLNYTPIHKRSIKKDLMNYRAFLINNNYEPSTVRSLFSKMKTIFRHYGLSIPDLPVVKLEKGYVANYDDLPTHDMIRIACNQSSKLIKAILLFMSSSGTAKAETLSITVEMLMKGFKRYYFTDEITNNNLKDLLKKLQDETILVPSIYLCRIKTNKYYYASCSTEASKAIIEYLLSRTDLSLDQKLFEITSIKLSDLFRKINDENNWGKVGKYRRFRSHTLRKFMASNIKLSRDYVDSLQGRSKDSVGEAYFKTNPEELREIYIRNMHNVTIFSNKPVTLNQPKINQDNKSIADELLTYSKLQKEGYLTIDEFNELKQKLLKKEGVII